MKKLFWLAVLGVIVLGVLINLFGMRAICFPESKSWPLALPFEEVSFSSGGNASVSAIYLPAKEGKDTILFFHGNAGNVTYFEDFAEVYAPLGYGILIFDYRGFGKSYGKITEQNIYEDSAAAVNYLLKEKKLPAKKIILWGYSLGGAAAVQTAVDFNETPFKAVVLQSAFTNTPEMAAALITGGYKRNSLLFKALTLYFRLALYDKRFDNLSKIKEIKAPLLVAYNEQDTLVPWEMSEHLFKSARAGAHNFASPVGKHTGFAWLASGAQQFLGSNRSEVK